MFLATTAVSEFWNKEEPLLFLGQWCMHYERRPEWESLDYSVLPKLWDDLGQFHNTVHYLEKRYEDLINDLTEYLNSVHGVSYKPRYWRILLGPWLRRYLQTVYDRYYHLKEAFRRHPDLNTYVLDPEDFQPQEDTESFARAVRSDEYNLMIFSQILKALGYEFPTRRLESGWSHHEVMLRARRTGLLRVILRSGKRTINFFERRITDILFRSRTIALCGMNLGGVEIWSLALRSGLKAVPLELKNGWSSPVPAQSNDGARTGLAALPTPDEFSQVFAQMLPANFPALYLEGYKTAQADTLQRYPKFPKVLTSLVAWAFNEPFKFLAAEASEKGTRLVASQHGGNYGVSQFIAEESHESTLSDCYLVWGWANGTSTTHKNLPSPKLSGEIGIHRPRTKASAKRAILLLGVKGPQYNHRYSSMPTGAQWEDYFDWEIRFLEASSERVRRNLIFRTTATDYGWGLKKRIADRVPDINYDDGRPFRQRLKSSDIIVVDNPVTTFLEALAANVPTIGFWDQDRWEFRAEAKPYFESLRDVGVLWDTPEEAAAKLESIYDDPWAWWGNDEVQKTRLIFVDRYALSSKDWATQWAKALKDQAELYQPANV